MSAIAIAVIGIVPRDELNDKHEGGEEVSAPLYIVKM